MLVTLVGMGFEEGGVRKIDTWRWKMFFSGGFISTRGIILSNAHVRLVTSKKPVAKKLV